MNSKALRIVDIFEKVNNLNINSNLISESLRDAKKFLDGGHISKGEFDKFLSMDKTPTKKYIAWLISNWINEGKPSDVFDELDKYISQYDDLVNKNKVLQKDINQFKNFKELKDVVNNALPAAKSKKDASSDYEVLINNDDLYVVVPYTHEAARKIGLRDFNFRDTRGKKDCAWCITFKSSDNWDSYFYDEEITFYFIKIKSDRLKNIIKKEFGGDERTAYQVKGYDGIALGVHSNGEKFAFDGLNNQMDPDELDIYLKLINLNA